MTLCNQFSIDREKYPEQAKRMAALIENCKVMSGPNESPEIFEICISTLNEGTQQIKTEVAHAALVAAISEAEEYHGSIKESNPDVASVLQMIIDAAKLVLEDSHFVQSDWEFATAVMKEVTIQAKNAVATGVNAKIADRVVRILRQLFDAKYPIQRMLLPDVYDADDETQMRDNNSSCFCYRNIAATNNLSKHARGLAIDINTLYNPYIKTLDDGTLLIQPATGEPYCDRSWDFPYKITHDDLCFKLFTEAGFEWGGD